MEISEIPFSEASTLAREAGRAGVDVKDTRNTTWWGCRVDGQLVAIYALMRAKAGTGRIKGAYIKAEHRGQGIRQQLFAACLERADAEGYAFLEAYSQRPNYLYLNGFRDTGKRLPNGAILVRRTL